MRNSLLLAALVFVATSFVFWPAVDHDFVVMDDPLYVYENPHVLGGLSPGNLAWAFGGIHASLYAPITWISFMLDVEREGTGPAGFHRTNVLLHALNAALLFWLLRRATGRVVPSLLVALLFALHPMRVESVAWVTERKDVLSTAFLLVAMHLHLAAVRRPSTGRRAALVTAMVLGLLSKPIVVVLPLLLLALDHWPLRREVSWRQRLREKTPLFVLALAFSVLTVLAHGRDGSGPLAEPIGLFERLGRLPVAYAFQIEKWVWPVDLAALRPDTVELPPDRVALGLVLLVAGTVLAAVTRRRAPAVATGWAWFVVALLPVSGLVRVGVTHLADRFGYVPSIGLAMGLVFGLAAAARGRTAIGRGLTALGVVAVVACTLALRPVLQHWKDSGTLFRHAIEVTGGSGFAHNYLGGWLAMEGRADEALPLLRRAVELEPRLADAHSNLGQVLLRRGDIEGALRHNRISVRLDPDRVAGQVSLGSALLLSGRIDEAEAAFRRAIALDPSRWEPHYNLGLLHASQGDSRRAVAELRRALALSPGNPRILARLQTLRGGRP